MKLRKAISRGMIRRALKPIPIIGTGAVVALAVGTIRRKGFFKGGADLFLDLVPFVGLTKGVVEAFTGDLIPDKNEALTDSK
jgi:hypothetical protein